MFFNMIVKVTLSGKRLCTILNCALFWFFIFFNMIVKVTLSGKRLCTFSNCAMIRLLSSVYPQVSLQITFFINYTLLKHENNITGSLALFIGTYVFLLT